MDPVRDIIVKNVWYRLENEYNGISKRKAIYKTEAYHNYDKFIIRQ